MKSPVILYPATVTGIIHNEEVFRIIVFHDVLIDSMIQFELRMSNILELSDRASVTEILLK